MLYGKPEKVLDKAYHASLRYEECDGKDLGGCLGDVCGAHFDGAGNKGWNSKTDDCYASPLCVQHHNQEGNGKGWADFWHKVYGNNTEKMKAAHMSRRLLIYLWKLLEKGEDKEIIRALRIAKKLMKP